MPRGVRKSSKEKLLGKQQEILESISEYKAAIKELEQQINDIDDELTKLQLMEISNIMDDNNLSADELKSMIEEYVTGQQAD